MTAHQLHGRSLLVAATLLWVLAEALTYAQSGLLDGFGFWTSVSRVLKGLGVVFSFAWLLWRGTRATRWLVVGLLAVESVLGIGFFLRQLEWIWFSIGMAYLVSCCLLLFPSVGAFLKHQRGMHSRPAEQADGPTGTANT
jgi:hypothetical protein